jgi:hypothetical protein
MVSGKSNEIRLTAGMEETMDDEFVRAIEQLCDALNHANDVARKIMAKHGVKTTESMFDLTQNKSLIGKMLDANKAAFDSEMLNILHGTLSKGIH